MLLGGLGTPWVRGPRRGFRKHLIDISQFPEQGKEKSIPVPVPPLFSKKAMPWGEKWPVQMNLPVFAVEAYVPGGGPESGRKKFEKCLPAGTGTKIYFSSRIIKPNT